MVKGWNRVLPFLLLSALLIPLFLLAPFPGVHAQLGYRDVKFRGYVTNFLVVDRWDPEQQTRVWVAIPVIQVSEVIEPPNALEVGVEVIVESPLSTTECGGPGSQDEVRIGDFVEVYARQYDVANQFILECSFHYLRRLDIVHPTVDVWTNKGGQGVGNLDGGQYSIGESITLYCSVSTNVDSLRIKVIRPDGVEVIVLDRGPSPAGTYQASGTVGEPPGERRVVCEARSGGQTSSDEVGYTVQQRATATVTVYTTTTRTVTSTLHATATTETTVYTTVYQTTSSTSTRTWYTTVTRTATTTVISWTTVTTTVLG
jgi:hypothetical protein